jgi:hypothetical protein
MPVLELADGRQVLDCRVWGAIATLMARKRLEWADLLSVGLSPADRSDAEASIRNTSNVAFMPPPDPQPLPGGFLTHLRYGDVPIYSVSSLPVGVVVLVTKQGMIFAGP